MFVGTHFPETREFYRTRFGGVRLVGSISGHWHGTRVWHDGEAAHWTSSTTGFGGIDFTPRGYRVVAVDGAGARSHWVTMEAPSAPAPRVSGRAAVLGDRLALATETGRRPRRGARARRVDTRPRRRRTRRRRVRRCASVYTTNLAARLVALDATTGALQWAHDLGDPSVRWNLGVPVVRGGRVYAGSAMSVHAFAADDGTPIWATELAPEDWAASWAGLTADDDTVVIAATNDHLDLAALDAHDGTVRWRHGSRDIAGVSTTPAIVGAYAVAARRTGLAHRVLRSPTGRRRGRSPSTTRGRSRSRSRRRWHSCAVLPAASPRTRSTTAQSSGSASWVRVNARVVRIRGFRAAHASRWS